MVSEELWNKILTCKDLQDVCTAKAASKTAITAKTVCNTMKPVKTANYRCVFIKKYDLDQHRLSNPPSTQIKQYHNHSYFFINDRNCNPSSGLFDSGYKYFHFLPITYFRAATGAQLGNIERGAQVYL